MPECPARSPEERKSDRWENIVGKAIKDWTTRIMMEQGVPREEARKIALARIAKLNTKEDVHEAKTVPAFRNFTGLYYRLRAGWFRRRGTNQRAVVPAVQQSSAR